MSPIQHATLGGSDLHYDRANKQAVRAASTANVTISTPGAIIDGVTLVNGDRVLLKNQTTLSENGLYTWASAATAMTRTTDADASLDFVVGFLVFCREGTVNAATYWIYTQTATVTLGATAITFNFLGTPLGGATMAAGGIPPGSAGALVPVATLTAVGGFNGWTLGQLPTTGFKNLRVVVIARSDTAAVTAVCNMRLNGDSSANYAHSKFTVTSSAGTASTQTAQTSGFVMNMPAGTALANAWGFAEIFIPNYLDATRTKNFVSRGGGVNAATATTVDNAHVIGHWGSTAAVNSLTFISSAGNFVAGTYFAVYGEMDTTGLLLSPASNLIYETTLSANSATVDTGLITQAYRDLHVVAFVRSSAAATSSILQVRSSGDLGSNYDYQPILNGVAGTAVAATSAVQLGRVAGNTAPANVFNHVDLWVPQYTSTSAHKSFLSSNTLKAGSTSSDFSVDQASGFWRSTAAITSLQFSMSDASSLMTGSVIRVYGEPAASGGIAVGTGTRLRMSANQSITTATATVVNWDTEDVDADNQHYTSSANLTGTVTKTAAATTLAGSGTAFLSELSVGQVIVVPGTANEKRVITAISSNGAATVNANWANTASGQTATRLNSPIVMRQPGFYTVALGAYFAAVAGGGVVTLQIKLNDTTVIAQVDPTAINAAAGYVLTENRQFSQWDFVEAIVTQSSGGNVNLTADERTHFECNSRPTLAVSIPHVILADRKTTNTNGGGFFNGADRTRDLNTIVYDSAGIMSPISSNAFTLPYGTYRCQITCPAFGVDRHQAALFLVDTSTDLVTGTSEVAPSGAQTRSLVEGTFSLNATGYTLTVVHRCQTTNSTDGFGRESNFGRQEEYTIAKFWKVG